MKNSIIIILAISLLSSCFTEKKAIREFYKINYKYPELVASNCNSLFPIKEKIVKETIYKEGRVDTVFDFAVLDCDTVTEVKYKNRIVKVKCPPSYTRTDTIIKSVYVNQESTSKVKALEFSVLRLNKDIVLKNELIQVKSNKVKFWYRFALILGIVLSLIIGIKIIQLKLNGWKMI